MDVERRPKQIMVINNVQDSTVRTNSKVEKTRSPGKEREKLVQRMAKTEEVTNNAKNDDTY